TAVIRLNLRSPTCVDLPSRVFFLLQSLMTEDVPQTSAFRLLDHPFSELGGNKDYAAVAAQYYVAGHYRCMTNPRRPVDADHGRVQALAARQRTEVMGGGVVA